MRPALSEHVRLLTPFRYRCCCGHVVAARTGQSALEAMFDHVQAMSGSMVGHEPIDWPAAVIERVVEPTQ